MSEDLKNKEHQSNYEENSSVKELKIKNNWKSLIYDIVRGTISNVGFGLIFIVFLKQWFWIAIVFFILLGIILSIIKWNYEYLEFSEDEAHYYSGIFSKETLIIPKKSFKSMDISQNLIERILGYKIVKIESPSKDFGKEEIKMSLNNEQIDRLKEFAFKSLENSLAEEVIINEPKGNDSAEAKNNIKSEIKEKKIEIKKLALYGFTSFNLFIALIFIFNIIGKLDDYINSDYLNNMIDGAISDTFSGASILLVVISLIALLILLKLIATFYYIIKYYNFTVLKDGNNIKISYGLFSTKEFSFKNNNIKLVKIKSNPLRQLFKLYELNLVIKGYTGEGNDKIILYPIGNLEEINDIICEFIPEWSFEGEGSGIKFGKFAMIVKPVIVIFIISVITYLIFKTNWMLIINLISIITVLNSVFKMRNLNLGIGDKKVRAVNGGLFRTIYILKGKDIQAVEFKTNPFQAKNGVGRITIDYYSESSEEIKLLYMEEKYVNELIKSSKGK